MGQSVPPWDHLGHVGHLGGMVKLVTIACGRLTDMIMTRRRDRREVRIGGVLE